MTTEKIRFVKNTDRIVDSYDVYIGETYIGYVHKTWKTWGGNGWSYQAADGHTSRRFDTRAQATRHMTAYAKEQA